MKFKEYEKIKNYSIKSTLRNIIATSNLEVDSKYIYVYAPNYFSSLSKDQLNGNYHRYLIGIKHLVGNPTFPLKILEREMFLIEKDYRETLLREIKNEKNIIFLDYSQKAEATNWFLDYSHFTEFAASEVSSKLAKDLIFIIK
tara:strand:- start:111 stop:539 length:429 start_codon:yes stop_codon:yes gene_type:complete